MKMLNRLFKLNYQKRFFIKGFEKNNFEEEMIKSLKRYRYIQLLELTTVISSSLVILSSIGFSSFYHYQQKEDSLIKKSSDF